MNIAKNLEQVRNATQGVILIAATKYVTSQEIRQLYAAGQLDCGENRAQDLLTKQAQLLDLNIRWHFIGHLQTNKVPGVINRIVSLHSLDSLKLAESIQKHRLGKLPCFVEVLTSDEVGKTGVLPEETVKFVENCAQYDTIEVVGLMTVAPNTADPSRLREAFETVRRLRDQITAKHWHHAPCTFLSMGMSSDYELAITCGATHVRLGSILFRNEES